MPDSALGPFHFQKEIELLLADLREVVPGFVSHGRLHMVGTFHGDWPVCRTWQGFDLPQKTPMENLYNVGDGVKLPGWSRPGGLRRNGPGGGRPGEARRA